MKSKFKPGDRVEHKFRGKGTFEEYDLLEDECYVKFDLDSDAEGDTLLVSEVLLSKITDEQK